MTKFISMTSKKFLWCAWGFWWFWGFLGWNFVEFECDGFFWSVAWIFWGFLFLMSKSKKIEAKIQIFYQIYMNFQHFGMKFACKGVAVLIFEA